MSSFVHDYLVEIDGLSDFTDNRPRAVRCVHPMVTPLEKLDAISRRFPRAATEPATFVRHYEDAAHIIERAATLPPLEVSPRSLADELVTERQIRRMPSEDDPAFQPQESPDWQALHGAFAAIQPMFWGARVPLNEACGAIREWVAAELGDRAHE